MLNRCKLNRQCQSSTCAIFDSLLLNLSCQTTCSLLNLRHLTTYSIHNMHLFSLMPISTCDVLQLAPIFNLRLWRMTCTCTLQSVKRDKLGQHVPKGPQLAPICYFFAEGVPFLNFCTLYRPYNPKDVITVAIKAQWRRFKEMSISDQRGESIVNGKEQLHSHWPFPSRRVPRIFDSSLADYQSDWCWTKGTPLKLC
jgi:hypothetical protein